MPPDPEQMVSDTFSKQRSAFRVAHVLFRKQAKTPEKLGYFTLGFSGGAEVGR